MIATGPPEGSMDFESLFDAVRVSHIVMILAPKGAPDAKISVELGLAMWLDKPILLLVRPGTKVPEKLSRIVDHVAQIPENWAELPEEEQYAIMHKEVGAVLEKIRGY